MGYPPQQNTVQHNEPQQQRPHHPWPHPTQKLERHAWHAKKLFPFFTFLFYHEISLEVPLCLLPNGRSWITWELVIKSRKCANFASGMNNFVCALVGTSFSLPWTASCCLATLNQYLVRPGIHCWIVAKLTLSAIMDNICLRESLSFAFL